MFYWQEDKSKIKPDGSKGGMWKKAKVVSIDGSMVGIDLGTRILQVKKGTLRKGKTTFPSKPGISLKENNDLLDLDPGPAANVDVLSKWVPARCSQ